MTEYLVKGTSKTFRAPGGGGGGGDLYLLSAGAIDNISQSDSDSGTSDQTIDGSSDPAWTDDGSGGLVVPEDGLYLVNIWGLLEADGSCAYTQAWTYRPGSQGDTVPILPAVVTEFSTVFLTRLNAADVIHPQATLYPTASAGSADFSANVVALRMAP